MVPASEGDIQPEQDQNSDNTSYQELKKISTEPATFSDGLVFLDSQSVIPSKKSAYLSMLEAWEPKLNPDENEDVCDFVTTVGLECLKKNGNMRSLLVLNRPAVLILVNAKGQALYAALTKIEQDLATVEVNGKSSQISVKDIESRWFGDYTLLWRRPPDYHGVIMPGSMGESVAWMADKLDMIYGTSLSRTSGISYDKKLVDQVKDFQLNAGLISDGIVGEQTLIYLNTITEKNAPRLKANDSDKI